MKEQRIRHYFLVFIILIIPFSGYCQFVLSGKITINNSVAVLPGATLILDEGLKSCVSDSQGIFSFSNVSKGNHTLTVSYVGFKTIKKKIQINSNLSLDFEMQQIAIMQDAIIVESTRVDAKSPTAYSTIDAKQIERQNLGADLPYLLQMTPSLVTSSDAGAGVGYTGLRIRGTDISRINVTLNGVPMNDAESHSVYFVDLPDIAASIDNVQVQRGVGTSTNGAAAFGASINIQTATFNPDPYAEMSSAVGSFNTFKNSASFGTGLINKNWTIDGRLSSIHSDGYIERGWSDLSSYYLAAGYYGNRSILKVIATSGREKTYQAWNGTPKDSLETNRRYNPSGEMLDKQGEITGYYDNQTDNYKQDYYQLHYAFQISEKLNTTYALFYTKGKGYYESYRNMDSYSTYGLDDIIIGGDTISETNLIRQKWLDNNFYGANIGLKYETDKLKLTFGGGINRYEGDHFGYIIWAEYAGNNAINKPWYENTGKKTDGNVFAKMNYQLNSGLNAYVDLQYRDINYKIDGLHDDLHDLTQQHQFQFFNPKAGLFYNLNNQSSLWVSGAVANREPNRSVYRDADLGQEISSELLIDYEAGYKLKLNSLQFESNIFYMDYKNQLVLTGQINNVGDAILVNVPKSYRSGIEIIASWHFLKQFDWNANATFSRNKIKNFVSYTDNWETWPVQLKENLGTTDISFSPNVVAGSIFTWNFKDKLKTSLVTNYVGKQYIDNSSNDDRSLHPYLINNIRLNYSVKTNFIQRIDFILSLNNIFDVEYESNAWVYRYYSEGSEYAMNGYFPQAKFHFMAGVNLRF